MSYLLDTPFSSKDVYINSKHCTLLNGNKLSDIYFEISDPIISHPQLSILFSITNFSFINSLYNINQFNNTFYYKINNNEYFHIIPDGFYDIDTLLIYLNSSVLDNFIFSFNERTMKITITNTSNFSLFYMNNHCFNILGFTNTNLSKSNTSDNLINISVNNIFIESSINVDSFSSISNRICFNTMITSAPGEFQQIMNFSNNRQILSEHSINNINLRFYDENHNLLNFNGINWTISFRFDVILQKDAPYLKYLNDEKNDENNGNANNNQLEFLEKKYNINNKEEKK